MAGCMPRFEIGNGLTLWIVLHGDGNTYIIREIMVWYDCGDPFVRMNLSKNVRLRMDVLKAYNHRLDRANDYRICKLSVVTYRRDGFEFSDRFVISVQLGARVASIELGCTRDTVGEVDLYKMA